MDSYTRCPPDVSGKEIAVYHSSNLDHWNVWGTDNVGKINANSSKFFYIKDHLGSVRVVLNSDNQIVSAIDYDCWGYPLENRSYQSDEINYKFTGKQRDAETGYDYFGARYYDARIANWTTTDPLLGKRIGYSPYTYVLRNPLVLIDPDGRIDVPEEYKSAYPQLYSFMKNDFERIVTSDKKLMSAFMERTGISEEELRQNLKDGQGPKLEIIQLGKDKNGRERMGHWEGKKYTIQLDVDLANKTKQSNPDKAEVYCFLVLITVAHEGAHGAAEQCGPPNSSSESKIIQIEVDAFGGYVQDYEHAAIVMNNRNIEAGIEKRYNTKEGEN